MDTDDVGKVLRGHRDGIGDITAKESAMQGGRPVDVEDDLGPCSESALWYSSFSETTLCAQLWKIFASILVS